MSRADRRRRVLESIRERIEARIYLGLLRPGDRVMTAREQARRLGVDPRMVMGAYRELEREGLVVRRERSGVFLAETAQVPAAREEHLVEWATEVLFQGLVRGLRVPEVPRWLERAVASVRLRAVCIECNADELQELCHELGQDYGFDTVPVELAATRDPGPRERKALATGDLLVTTTAHAREVGRLAASYGRPWMAVDRNPEWGRKVGELLESGPVWLVAADARFARKMRRSFRASHPASDLRVVVLGRDDPAAIPAGSAVWATRVARERFEAPATLSLMPEVRMLAPDSARALLGRLVRANIGRPAAGA